MPGKGIPRPRWLDEGRKREDSTPLQPHHVGHERTTLTVESTFADGKPPLWDRITTDRLNNVYIYLGENEGPQYSLRGPGNAMVRGDPHSFATPAQLGRCGVVSGPLVRLLSLHGVPTESLDIEAVRAMLMLAPYPLEAEYWRPEERPSTASPPNDDAALGGGVGNGDDGDGDGDGDGDAPIANTNAFRTFLDDSAPFAAASPSKGRRGSASEAQRVGQAYFLALKPRSNPEYPAPTTPAALEEALQALGCTCATGFRSSLDHWVSRVVRTLSDPAPADRAELCLDAWDCRVSLGIQVSLDAVRDAWQNDTFDVDLAQRVEGLGSSNDAYEPGSTPDGVVGHRLHPLTKLYVWMALSQGLAAATHATDDQAPGFRGSENGQGNSNESAMPSFIPESLFSFLRPKGMPGDTLSTSTPTPEVPTLSDALQVFQGMHFEQFLHLFGASLPLDGEFLLQNPELARGRPHDTHTMAQLAQDTDGPAPWVLQASQSLLLTAFETLSTPTALLCPVWESLKLIKALIVAQKASEWERTLSDVGHMAAMVQWCTPILAWNMVQVNPKHLMGGICLCENFKRMHAELTEGAQVALDCVVLAGKLIKRMALASVDAPSRPDDELSRILQALVPFLLEERYLSKVCIEAGLAGDHKRFRELILPPDSPLSPSSFTANEHSPKPNPRVVESASGHTLLTAAIASGSLECVQDVCSLKGVDINARSGRIALVRCSTDEPDPLFLWASASLERRLDLNVAERETIDPDAASAQMAYRTPLMDAASAGKAPIVRFLCKLGAQRQYFDSSSRCAESLAAAPAGPSDEDGQIVPFLRADAARFSLAHFVLQGDLSVVRFLLEQGYDVNEGAGPDLSHKAAAETPSVPQPKVVVDHGKEATPTAAGSARKQCVTTVTVGTPLIVAASTGNMQMLELLLSYPGIAVNGRNALGETALHYAAGLRAEDLPAFPAALAPGSNDAAGPNVARRAQATPALEGAPPQPGISEPPCFASDRRTPDQSKASVDMRYLMTVRTPEYGSLRDDEVVLSPRDPRLDRDVSVALVLLKHGADRTIKDLGGWSAVDWAQEYGSRDLRHLLLCDPDAGASLTGAAKASDVRATRALLLQGCDPNARCPVKGFTPLIAAAFNNDHGMLKVLLSHPSIEVDKPHRDSSMTPLMYAAEAGYTQIVSELLTAGANRYTVNVYNKTAYDMAFDRSMSECCLLLRYDPERSNITYFAADGHSEAISSLLRQGMDPNAAAEVKRLVFEPTIHAASTWHAPPSRELPLGQLPGRSGSPTTPDLDGTGALSPNTVRSANAPSVISSLTNGSARASPNNNTTTTINGAGQAKAPPLAVLPATAVGKRRFVEEPVAHELYSPLIAAATHQRIEVVRLLLQHPCIQVDRANTRGETALMYAAGSGCEKVVLQLLEAGADRYAVDHRGRSAMHWAIHQVHKQQQRQAVTLHTGAAIPEEQSVTIPRRGNGMPGPGRTYALSSIMSGDATTDASSTCSVESDCSGSIGFTSVGSSHRTAPACTIRAASSAWTALLQPAPLAAFPSPSGSTVGPSQGALTGIMSARKRRGSARKHSLSSNSSGGGTGGSGGGGLAAELAHKLGSRKGRRRQSRSAVAREVFEVLAAATVSELIEEFNPALATGVISILRVDPKVHTMRALAADGDVDGIVGLVKQGGDVNAVTPHSKAQTALIAAAICGRTDVLKLLLNHPKVDVDLRDSESLTALMHAAIHGREAEVVDLLGAGADRHLKTEGKECLTSRELALKHGHLTIAWVLAADPDQTSLHEAAQSGQLNLVHGLLKQPQRVDVNSLDETLELDMQTPLIAASARGHRRVVARLLQEPGVDVNLLNAEGESALMHAALSGNMEVCSALIIAGADSQVVDADGARAIHWALRNNFGSMLHFIATTLTSSGKRREARTRGVAEANEDAAGATAAAPPSDSQSQPQHQHQHRQQQQQQP